MFLFKTSVWTSELIIKYEKYNNINSLVKYYENLIFNSLPSKFNNIKTLQRSKLLDIITSYVPLNKLVEFGSYNNNLDLTGIFKGLFIYFISKEIEGKLLISFGHDILVNDYPININGLCINNTSIFCSSNEDIRGNHIKVVRNNLYKSVIVINSNPIICDYEATSLIANNEFKVSEFSKVIFLNSEEYKNILKGY